MPDFWGSSDYTYSGHNPTHTHILVRPCVPRWRVENVDTNLIAHVCPWSTLPEPEQQGGLWRTIRTFLWMEGCLTPRALPAGWGANGSLKGQPRPRAVNVEVWNSPGLRRLFDKASYQERVYMILFRPQASLPAQRQSHAAEHSGPCPLIWPFLPVLPWTFSRAHSWPFACWPCFQHMTVSSSPACLSHLELVDYRPSPGPWGINRSKKISSCFPHLELIQTLWAEAHLAKGSASLKQWL